MALVCVLLPVLRIKGDCIQISVYRATDKYAFCSIGEVHGEALVVGILDVADEGESDGGKNGKNENEYENV